MSLGIINHHRPAKEEASSNLRELWAYRDLLYFLTWRNIKVQYRQTVLGAAWAVLQPFLMMVALSFFFGRLARIPSHGVPYSLFFFAALVPWTFFVNSLFHSTSSLVVNADLIKKVYFPRVLIPLSSIASDIIDFLLAFLVLAGMMLYFGRTPTVHILWLPFFFLLAFLTALGAGLWLSALNVKYRDISCAMPFLSQLWFVATPVIYSSVPLPTPWRTLLALNPMTAVIEGFRWTLLGAPPPEPDVVIVSTGVMFLLLASGAFYFQRAEQTFADVV